MLGTYIIPGTVPGAGDSNKADTHTHTHILETAIRQTHTHTLETAIRQTHTHTRQQ